MSFSIVSGRKLDVCEWEQYNGLNYNTGPYALHYTKIVLSFQAYN